MVLTFVIHDQIECFKKSVIAY